MLKKLIIAAMLCAAPLAAQAGGNKWNGWLQCQGSNCQAVVGNGNAGVSIWVQGPYTGTQQQGAYYGYQPNRAYGSVPGTQQWYQNGFNNPYGYPNNPGLRDPSQYETGNYAHPEQQQ